MKEKELLTDCVSFDSMSEVYAANNPGFQPNKSNVGRFAKRVGYRLAKQMIDKKFVYFYIKNKQTPIK